MTYISDINLSLQLPLYLKSSSQILSSAFFDLLTPRRMFKCGVTHSQNNQGALRGFELGLDFWELMGWARLSELTTQGQAKQMISNRRVVNQSSEEGLVTAPTRMSIWNLVQLMSFYSKAGNLCEVLQLFSYLLVFSHKPETCQGCELLPLIGGRDHVAFFILDRPLYKLPNMSLSFFILDHPHYKLPNMSLSFPWTDVLAYPSLAQHKKTEVENISQMNDIKMYK